MLTEPVTVTMAHQVTPGREDDFRAWATGMLMDAARSGHYLGGGILSPGASGGEWHIVYRWSDQDAARRWEVSSVHEEWTAHAAEFTLPVGTHSTAGVRAWFDLPAKVRKPPPKWKTAVVTLAAVFPPVFVFNVTVIPFLGNVSVVLRTLALCVGVTAVVTWVMMPNLMRLLKDWLHPVAPPRRAHRQAPAPVAASAALLRPVLAPMAAALGINGSGAEATPSWVTVSPQGEAGQPAWWETPATQEQPGPATGQPPSPMNGLRRERIRQPDYRLPQPVRGATGGIRMRQPAYGPRPEAFPEPQPSARDGAAGTGRHRR